LFCDARTLRPRIGARLDEFMVALRPTPLARAGGAATARGLDLEDVDRLLARMRLDRGVPSVSHLFRGGTDQARARLRAFIAGPDQGVTYRMNTWHHGLTVLDKPGRFAVFMWRDGGKGDEEFVPVKPFVVRVP